MSIDRRIVSILYYNGIEDVNLVEKFIGEKNNYYQVVVNGEVLNLKIPGKHYIEIFEDFSFEEENISEPEIIDFKIEELKTEEIELLNNFNDQLEKPSELENLEKKETFEQKTFEEELLESEKELKNLEKSFVKTTKTVTTKLTTKKDIPDKKIKKVDIKKVDNDIDDFINLA